MLTEQSAYVSIRQHTVSIRRRRRRHYADRMLTLLLSLYCAEVTLVIRRMLTYADVC